MDIINDNINGIEVVYIKTNKFKSVSGTIFFKTNIAKHNITKRETLKSIMIDSCKKYNTNEKLNINTLENYSANYYSKLSRIGHYLINSYTFMCLNDKYINDNVIDNVVDTFYEIIHNPNVTNGSFDQKVFDLCYKKGKTLLETQKERTRIYGYNKLKEKLDKNSLYSCIPNIEDLEKINSTNLYDEYKEMINNSEIKLFLIGDFDYKKVAKKILGDLKTLDYKGSVFDENVKNKEKLEEYKESINTSGSIMFFGTKLFGLTPYEKSYVMPVYSCILGGGAGSRCFDIIREKNSLAYYCYSRYDKDDLLLTLIAGIDKSNYTKTKNLMIEVIDGMKDIKNDEIQRAKKEITTTIKESEDYPIAPLNMNYYKELYGECSIEDKIEMFNNVSKEDLIKINDKIIKDCIYLLEGDK